MIQCSCPECGSRCTVADEATGTILVCRQCQTRFKAKGSPPIRRRRDDEDYDDEYDSPRQREFPIWILAILIPAGVLFLGAVLAVGLIAYRDSAPSSSQTASAASASREAPDLARARSGFHTKLKRKGSAPQAYENTEPPKGVRAVAYQSGDLTLKGWLSSHPGDGKRHPAVVYLHGGWSFALEDWRDAAPFAASGFVLFMPMLRAENGNPGSYEGFYGEVNDAIAAGHFVASLPFVDPANVFVAGHSVGAVLTVLVCMVPSPYKAGAALSGYLDMQTWAATELDERVVFDAADPEEVRVRNPMAFVPSLRLPLTLFTDPAMRPVNEVFAARAKRLGKDCELVVVPGNHRTMVAPAVKQCIQRFRKYIGD